MRCCGRRSDRLFQVAKADGSIFSDDYSCCNLAALSMIGLLGKGCCFGVLIIPIHAKILRYSKWFSYVCISHALEVHWYLHIT
jgi:hypothetical protein